MASFRLTIIKLVRKTYTLTNQTDKPRVVFMSSIPCVRDWTLSDDTAKPDGKSARYYRFPDSPLPHQKVELPVTNDDALMDTYALLNFTRQDLELFISQLHRHGNARRPGKDR